MQVGGYTDALAAQPDAPEARRLRASRQEDTRAAMTGNLAGLPEERAEVVRALRTEVKLLLSAIETFEKKLR